MLRSFLLCGSVILALGARPASAGDKPLAGPVPAWVVPAPASSLEQVSRSANELPLLDQQAFVDGDKVTTYVDTAKVITSPDDLKKAGTISVSWRPEHGDLTFHRITILRDGEQIDALGDVGQFTVLRREAGLENQMINGRLTAVKHLEDLRVGDILRLTISISESDPVLDGNVQDGMVLIASPARIGFGRVRLLWPRLREITWKALSPGVSVSPNPIAGNLNELSVALPIDKLAEMPKNFPSRFQPIPLLTFSSFGSWSEVAGVTARLYRVEGLIEPDSDLSRVVDAIAERSSDPVQRMAEALRIVQDEVRYQLIALSTGNYKPQTPADTWAKRYGDCKAKSLLLLAMLDRLGIQAEPVLASSKRGDAVETMPPGLFAFDHVFVRAKVGEEDFWLDGTVVGQRLADIRDVPRYGKVLPVFAGDGALVELPRRANARPGVDVDLTYDYSAGPHFPAPFRLKVSYAGTWAESHMVRPGADYDGRLEKFAADAANTWTSSTTIGKPQASHDPQASVWTLSMEGVSYPDWQFADGRYELALQPALGIAIDAERGKSAWRNIPALIDNPWTAQSRRSFILANAGKDVLVDGDRQASLSLPAVAWTRSIEHKEGLLVEQVASRESGEEIPAGEVSQAVRTVETETGRAVRIVMPETYPRRWIDAKQRRSGKALGDVRRVFEQRIADKPEEADRLADRGWFSARLFDWDAAEDFYGKAIALDPSAARFVDRGWTRESRGNYEGALEDAQQAFDLEGGNENARSLLATSLAKAGRVDEGLDLLDTNPDVTTEDGLTEFLLRIDVLADGRRYDDIAELLDAAIARRPSLTVLQTNRCWFNALLNRDLDDALADCDRSIELSSEPAGALESRAVVHYRAGRLQEARLDLGKVLALEPERTSALYMFGIVENKLDNPQAGADWIGAARQLEPGIDRFFERYGISPK